jgi:hypothetical protein
LELNRIVEKVAFKNNIPLDTFKEIFKDSQKLADLFTILRFWKGKLTNTREQRYYKRKEIAID